MNGVGERMKYSQGKNEIAMEYQQLPNERGGGKNEIVMKYQQLSNEKIQMKWVGEKSYEISMATHSKIPMKGVGERMK
jgi:hypothetical protein